MFNLKGIKGIVVSRLIKEPGHFGGQRLNRIVAVIEINLICISRFVRYILLMTMLINSTKDLIPT